VYTVDRNLPFSQDKAKAHTADSKKTKEKFKFNETMNKLTERAISM
jgi:hypothetical protein